MIISFSKNFIYLKSPKTAGSSVEEALSWSCDLKTDIISPDDCRPGVRHKEFAITLKNHSRPVHLIESGAITQDQFNSMYKIATARNPWEQQVSRWWWVVTKIKAEDPKISYKNLSIEEVSVRYISDFRIWAQRFFTKPKGVLLNDNAYYFDETGEYFLQDIIRYETLQDDFNRVLDKLGIKRHLLPHRKIKSRLISTHYRDYYTEELRDLIAYNYQKIIQYFGYEF